MNNIDNAMQGARISDLRKGAGFQPLQSGATAPQPWMNPTSNILRKKEVPPVAAAPVPLPPVASTPVAAPVIPAPVASPVAKPAVPQLETDMGLRSVTGLPPNATASTFQPSFGGVAEPVRQKSVVAPTVERTNYGPTPAELAARGNGSLFNSTPVQTPGMKLAAATAADYAGVKPAAPVSDIPASATAGPSFPAPAPAPQIALMASLRDGAKAQPIGSQAQVRAAEPAPAVSAPSMSAAAPVESRTFRQSAGSFKPLEPVDPASYQKQQDMIRANAFKAVGLRDGDVAGNDAIVNGGRSPQPGSFGYLFNAAARKNDNAAIHADNQVAAGLAQSKYTVDNARAASAYSADQGLRGHQISAEASRYGTDKGFESSMTGHQVSADGHLLQAGTQGRRLRFEAGKANSDNISKLIKDYAPVTGTGKDAKPNEEAMSMANAMLDSMLAEEGLTREQATPAHVQAAYRAASLGGKAQANGKAFWPWNDDAGRPDDIGQILPNTSGDSAMGSMPSNLSVPEKSLLRIAAQRSVK